MKKKVIALITLILISAPLFAVSFGYNILEVRTMPEFGEGVFPTSLMYQFNFPTPNFISGSKTLLAFRLDNGLIYRTLRQSPTDGYLYAKDAEYNGEFDSGDSKEYSVQFDEFNLLFSQGFFKYWFPNADLFTVGVSIDGRFEKAYERLSWLAYDGNTQGVFTYYNTSGKNVTRFPSTTSWIGAPELIDDRSAFMLSFSAWFEINHMRDKISRRDGVKAKIYMRYSPEALQLFDSPARADFFALYANIDLAFTPFYVTLNKLSDVSWGSAVIDWNLCYRFITGEKVPAYIQGGELWEVSAPNSKHVLTSRLSLSLYGPRVTSTSVYPVISVFGLFNLNALNSIDTYPEFTFFWDCGYSFGALLNRSVSEKIGEWVGSVGLKARFVILGIAELYYEFGYVYDPAFNESQYFKQTYGFSIGI